MIVAPDAFPALKEQTASLISSDISRLFANLKTTTSETADQKAGESEAKTASEVISTGLSSIGSIHYSRQADSTQIIFELEDMGLIRTGKLSSPHRVYVDLQDIHWHQNSFKGTKTLKALEIDDDLLSRVRIKQREAGVTRIVLDLKQCCDFSYLIPHESPSHLIVQLRPV